MWTRLKTWAQEPVEDVRTEMFVLMCACWFLAAAIAWFPLPFKVEEPVVVSAEDQAVLDAWSRAVEEFYNQQDAPADALPEWVPGGPDIEIGQPYRLAI